MTFAPRTLASPLFVALLLAAGVAGAQDIVRHKLPNSDFPIAQAVTLPPNATIHFISGQVPPIVNKSADPNALAAFGDTKLQTVGVLNKIKEILAGMGLGMGDVVKMQVFLVGDPAKAGRADVTGFMEGYTQFFGGAQPNLPARAVMQVAALSNPGWLVEIEVVAAKK
nr:Endoribonuclease L-PSP [uncultured organism]